MIHLRVDLRASVFISIQSGVMRFMIEAEYTERRVVWAEEASRTTWTMSSCVFRVHSFLDVSGTLSQKVLSLNNESAPSVMQEVFKSYSLL